MGTQELAWITRSDAYGLGVEELPRNEGGGPGVRRSRIKQEIRAVAAVCAFFPHATVRPRAECLKEETKVT